MQLIFCMQLNIKVFHKLILSLLTGVARMPKIPKITSLQYLINDLLDYLGFRHVHRPPNHGSNTLHKCQSKTIGNDNFYLKKRRQRPGFNNYVFLDRNFINYTNIIPVIIFNKKEEDFKLDLKNMRKQGPKVEKLVFSFVDFLVKMIYAKRQKSQLFLSDYLMFCPR